MKIRTMLNGHSQNFQQLLLQVLKGHLGSGSVPGTTSAELWSWSGRGSLLHPALPQGGGEPRRRGHPRPRLFNTNTE